MVRLGFGCVVLSGLAVAAGAAPGLAQSNIVTDGTLGGSASGVLRFAGPQVELIEGGLQSGKNLFHSFDALNVAEGWQVYFLTQDVGTENILARVTGTERSEILGTLGTIGFFDGQFSRADTNLFLINPNGILFGSGAELSVGSTTRGAFFATTLDGVVWPDGGRFDGVEPQEAGALLNIVGDPGGFVASQRQISGIEVNDSYLGVDSGQSLLLLGGEVTTTDGFLFIRFPTGGESKLLG